MSSPRRQRRCIAPFWIRIGCVAGSGRVGSPWWIRPSMRASAVHTAPGSPVAETPRPADPPQDGSIVSITLHEVAPGSTEISLVQSRLSGFPDEDPAGIAEAWTQALGKLSDLYARG